MTKKKQKKTKTTCRDTQRLSRTDQHERKVFKNNPQVRI